MLPLQSLPQPRQGGYCQPVGILIRLMHHQDVMPKMVTQVAILRAGSSFAATLARLENATKAFSNGLLR